MAKKGIEELIADLDAYVENAKYSYLSTNKITLAKDELKSYINELRQRLPSEIERSKKIMKNKEAILADARNRADAMLVAAGEEAEKRVAEGEITRIATAQAQQLLATAQAQAEQIVAQATAEANEIRLGSLYYTQDNLDNIKKYVLATLEAEKTNYMNLIASLENDAFVLNTNSAEIENQIRLVTGQPLPPEKAAEQKQAVPENAPVTKTPAKPEPKAEPVEETPVPKAEPNSKTLESIASIRKAPLKEENIDKTAETKKAKGGGLSGLLIGNEPVKVPDAPKTPAKPKAEKPEKPKKARSLGTIVDGFGMGPEE